MTVLVVSADQVAARALCFALQRSGQNAIHETTVTAAREQLAATAPLVLVADTDVLDHEELLDEVLRERPWTRVHVMSDDVVSGSYHAINKPFDASEVAQLISREREIARAEERQVKLQRQLEHSERLVAIGRLSASMAHEINNPLSVIVAAVEAVTEAAARHKDTDLAECADDMQLAASRIRGFVQHICGYSRRERPELREHSVQDAVDVALRMVRPRARDKEVTLFPGSAASIAVPHDTTRVSQAVLNLLSNAVDAAAEGDHHVWLAVESSDDGVTIHVDDDGPGLPVDLLERMFEPFATTKPPGQGTGLGLAITRQIVADHGGDVHLTPREAGGMRATLWLPAFRPELHRVLVVEDDPAVRRALVADLRRSRFDVVSVGSLSEAEDHLESSPAAVVTDLSLSDGNGAAFLERLAEHYPEVGRVVVSGRSDLDVSYADYRLLKPWDKTELAAAVRGACLLVRSGRASRVTQVPSA
ncbi:MAG: hybrid sensor histidine kinase/response regulator [Polyangiaceae bacterium]